MRSHLTASVDCGSSLVRAVIGALDEGHQAIRIIGVGTAPAGGVRRGAIVSPDDAAGSIIAAVTAAERMAGAKVSHVVASLGGYGIAARASSGVVAVGRADGEVTADDRMRALAAAQAISVPVNREVIHVIPRQYRLDDQGDIRDPVGMTGVRLELDALVIEAPVVQSRALSNALAAAGLSADEVVAAPLAVSSSVLDARQRELGVAVVDIGGAVTSLAVYEEDRLLHASVLPVGAAHITNDLAIGARTTLDTAERIKLEYGTARAADVARNEEIDLGELDAAEDGTVSRHHMCEIIEARCEEIFSLVNKELATIHRAGLLPAGVVLTGGGAKLPHIVEFAKGYLKLPIQIGYPRDIEGVVDHVDDPAFSTAIGLIQWHRTSADYGAGAAAWGAAGDALKRLRSLAGKFLP